MDAERLAEIEKDFGGYDGSCGHIRELVAEVRRLQAENAQVLRRVAELEAATPARAAAAP